MSETKHLKRKITFRLYPTRPQKQALEQMLILHQQLYNMALQQRVYAYKHCGVSLNYHQQAKDLTDLRAFCPEYESLNAQSCQNTLKRLHKAFQGFFSRLKKGEKAGFPRFKALSRYSGWGYNAHGDGWKLFSSGKHGYVRISGVGMVKMRGKARVMGQPKTMEVMLKQGKWYASITLIAEAERDRGEEALGLDWGVEHFVTIARADGTYESIENQRHLRRHLKHLRRLQRMLSKKKKGSKNRKKAREQVSGLHAKIARQRKDFMHQKSAAIVSRANLIAVEKLTVKNMTSKGGKRKRGLNREILSTSPGEFHNMLKSKAEEAGVIYKEINTRKVKPSQTCSGCGEQKKKSLNDRQHVCLNCGLKLNRDANAARVILNAALKEVGQELSRCGEKSEDLSLKHETPSTPT